MKMSVTAKQKFIQRSIYKNVRFNSEGKKILDIGKKKIFVRMNAILPDPQ